MIVYMRVTCPGCGANLEAPVAIDSVLCQDKYVKVNFARVEVQHVCPSRKGPVENAGS